MQLTEALRNLCKNNDVRSHRIIYDLFKSTVMGLCRRYTRNKEEAEDVFQETFIRIFKNIRQLNEIENPAAWIRKIAVNTAITYYHKHKRHHSHADCLEYEGQNEDYELILSNFSDEKLLELINNLPDGYRMVFNLYAIEGYSHAEIGVMLSISEATSRSQLNRARQVLKDQLKSIGIFKYEKYA